MSVSNYISADWQNTSTEELLEAYPKAKGARLHQVRGELWGRVLSRLIEKGTQDVFLAAQSWGVRVETRGKASPKKRKLAECSPRAGE